MAFVCFKCGAQQSLASPTAVGRRDECSKCGADIHVCRNCQFYDPAAYNECREPSAERVLEKERSNFCDYFSFRQGSPSKPQADTKKDPLKSLDDLFK